MYTINIESKYLLFIELIDLILIVTGLAAISLALLHVLRHVQSHVFLYTRHDALVSAVFPSLILLSVFTHLPLSKRHTFSHLSIIGHGNKYKARSL